MLKLLKFLKLLIRLRLHHIFCNVKLIIIILINIYDISINDVDILIIEIFNLSYICLHILSIIRYNHVIRHPIYTKFMSILLSDDILLLIHLIKLILFNHVYLLHFRVLHYHSLLLLQLFISQIILCRHWNIRLRSLF